MSFRKIQKNDIRCRCGCGSIANSGDWVIGHWNRGIVRTPEQRKKIGDSQRGRSQNPELVKKRVEAIRLTRLRDSSVIERQRETLLMTRMKKAGWDLEDKEGYRLHVRRNNKMRALMINLLYRCIYGLGHLKTSRTFEELGYSAIELKAHLESKFLPGMSWENHGSGPDDWQIDHIRPISSFQEGTSPKIVNALSNLQPLWRIDNLSKSDKFHEALCR